MNRRKKCDSIYVSLFIYIIHTYCIYNIYTPHINARGVESDESPGNKTEQREQSHEEKIYPYVYT